MTLNLYRVCVYREEPESMGNGRGAAETIEWFGTSRQEVERTLGMLGLKVLYFAEELLAVATPPR